MEHAGRDEEQTATPDLQGVIDAIDERDFPFDVVAERTVRVIVTAGDVVMTCLPFLQEASGPAAILAEAPDGTSAVLMRDGADLFVVRRSPGVWEHFRAPGGPSAVIGSWRSGERARFRQRHGALWKAIPAARDLAERVGALEHLPAEVPPPPPPSTAPSRTTRTRAERADRTTTRPPAKKTDPTPTPPPPPPPVCPRCFMELPASGVCDC